MMWDRWKKLEKAFYNSEADQFDISKIPDIYDSIKFDCIHNSHLDCDYSKVRAASLCFFFPFMHARVNLSCCRRSECIAISSKLACCVQHRLLSWSLNACSVHAWHWLIVSNWTQCTSPSTLNSSSTNSSYEGASPGCTRLCATGVLLDTLALNCCLSYCYRSETVIIHTVESLSTGRRIHSRNRPV